MNSILKIKYTSCYMDISLMKTITGFSIEIDSKGTITIRRYQQRSRKIQKKKIYDFNKQDFDEMCHKLRQCIDNADVCEMMQDSSYANVYIEHLFGRKESMPDGLGIEVQGITIRGIISEFVNANCYDMKLIFDEE